MSGPKIKLPALKGQQKATEGKKDQAGKTKKDAGHLTMCEVSRANPLAARYLEFSRLILTICQTGGHTQSERDRRLAISCEAFYISECAKNRSGLALNIKDKKKGKAQASSGEGKKVEKPEKRKMNKIGETARKCARVFPTIKAIPFVGIGDDRKHLPTKSNSVLDQIHHGEYVELVGKLPVKDQNALSKITEVSLEDRKFLNSEKYQEVTKALMEKRKDEGGETKIEPEEVATWFPPDSFWKTRMTVTAFKQYHALKSEGMLLTDSHLQTTIRVLQEVAIGLSTISQPPTDLTRKLIETGRVAEEDLHTRGTEPFWKKSRNLGRIHPRVVALQLLEDGNQRGMEEWTELCKLPFFAATVTEYVKRPNLEEGCPSPPEAGEQFFIPENETVVNS